MEKTTNELQRTTNFAELMEQKIQKELEDEEQNARLQEDSGKEHHERIMEHTIRKRNMEDLHVLIDKYLDRRENGFHHAELEIDTSRQWDLIAAAVEEACIDFFNLQGREATT